MPGFSRGPGGVTVSFDAQEAGLLRRLLDEMRSLLDSNAGRVDPVVDRLFPKAYGGSDPEAEEEYQRYAGSDLGRAKLDAVREALSDLGPDGPATMQLTGDRTATWLAMLTDLRLAIGTRLEVDEDKMSEPIDPRDPEAPALSVLHWLGWVQEELLARL